MGCWSSSRARARKKQARRSPRALIVVSSARPRRLQPLTALHTSKNGRLKPKFDANKCKVNLKMLQNRQLLQQKKTNLAKQQKRQVAMMLKDDKEAGADPGGAHHPRGLHARAHELPATPT